MTDVRLKSMADLDSAELAERTRQLIVGADLSVSEISRLTRAKYGADSSYFIADTFISTIRKGVSPHICQIVALSDATRLPFADLMQHFGFDLRQMTRLQMKLHPDRTVLITPNECSTLSPPNLSRYLYAQIGRQDGMGFPEVMPGSIVRINTTRTSVPPNPGIDSRRSLYVVDHLRGLSCCYVTALNERDILLTPHHLPYECLEYRLGEQARILGMVDAELRPLQGIEVPYPAVSDGFERKRPVPATDAPQKISHLLRNSRERTGLSFRRARDLTVRVAEEVGDQDCAIALGTLSDYEAVDVLPRHAPKIISLCIAYAIDFSQYLASAGIALNAPTSAAGNKSSRRPGPVPLPLLNTRERNRGTSLLSQSHFPPSLIDAKHELLRNKSDSLQAFSVRNVLKGDAPPEALLIVDRCSRTLEESAWPAAWQRPVYMVKKRDGEYIYGFCTVTDGIMTVHHNPTKTRVVDRFYRKEADVVGQVVTIVRSIA